MAFSFDTVFKISALFTGAAAISQAQQGLQKVEQTGLLANMSLKKLAATIGGLAAGAFTIEKVTGFLNSSIDAARKAKTTYANLGTTLASLPQLQKLGSQAIKDQTKLLADLAKTMEKQGGLAATTLTAAFDQLSKSGLSPAKVIDMSNAYQDMLVRVNGIKVTAEQAAISTEKWVQAVKVGGAGSGQALVDLGILTTEQIGKYESLKTANDRYNFTLGEMNKHIGETSAAMKTADGVQVRFANAWNQIKVAIGTPFVAVQDKLTEAMTKIQGILVGNMDKIVTAITPVVDRLSGQFVGWISKFVDRLPEYMPKIEEFANTIGKVFDWFLKNGTGVTQAVGSIAGAFALFTGFVKIAAGVKSITGAITGLSAAFKVMQAINIGATLAAMAPFWPVLVIGAIAAAIYLLVTHWKDVKKFALDCWDAIKAATTVAASNLAENWQHIVNGATAAWDGIKKAFTDSWAAIQGAWNGAVDWFSKNIVDPIVLLWQNFPQLVVQAIGSVGKLFASWETGIVDWFTKHLIDPVVNLFKNLPKMIGEAMMGLGGILQRVMSEAWNQMLSKLPFGWGEKFKVNIPAEAPGPPVQKEHTEAVKKSTDALYGKSPGFIPGLQAATKQLNAFVPALQQATVASSQVGMSMGAAGGFGGGVGGPVGAGAGAAMSLGAGGMSGSAMGVGGAFGGTKFTHYGYKKDSTPDWNSAHGIGDRSNRLVDRYSAALTLSERFARFGTRGHSTGQEFVFAGHRLRDDDTAPESDRRVDLYDPYSTASSAYGRLFTHPALTAIGERRPELALPLESTGRSRNLLSAAASMIGMGRGGGASPVALNMSVPITINGVQAGHEGAIAREVKAAMQDPVRQLLEQLRKAKQHEQRLSYA